MAGEVDSHFRDQGGIDQKKEAHFRQHYTRNCDNTRGQDPLNSIQLWG